MEYLAHSASDSIPPQSYASHVEGVFHLATQYAEKAERYSTKSAGQLISIVQRSAEMHDLGKLDEKNQEILHNLSSKDQHLPINHVDAGSAALISSENIYSALAVYSHHKGLPDMANEMLRDEFLFRDEHPDVRNHIDCTLQDLLRRHTEMIPGQELLSEVPYEGDQSVFFRMVLSCLADADHTDTANHYGNTPRDEKMPLLRANERLASFDQYVSSLGNNDERSILRKEMYIACRDAENHSSFCSCDSPVGSGKTIAVMAHLLKQAYLRNARHIFVILPYTSIIQQSVAIYRKALVLPGENPEKVVAELHCRADFENRDTRYLTALWRAPIIVTTAVAFFETLASAKPASLRRFHELPGSVFFMDEAHNMLPLKLLPLSWRWMNILANEWSCYWVLASGSLVRYWQLKSFESLQIPHPDVPELVSEELHMKLMRYETNRISFKWKSEALSYYALIDWIQRMPGPRLLIVNTVQSAAVIANRFQKIYGKNSIEHLSTALTPEDRGIVIEQVKSRLENKNDSDWTLVATSCVEAGVDFSFRTGFREVSSLLSLLQASGRVNRHGDMQMAEMWSFSLRDDPLLKKNPGMDISSEVLLEYLKTETAIVPDLSTQSMNDEITRNDVCIHKIQAMLDLEENMQFREINDQYQVIDSDTVTAVVDSKLAACITAGKGNWQQLQKKAVSIRRNKIQEWKLQEIAKGIYQWTLPYDSFLGYMSGVIQRF